MLDGLDVLFLFSSFSSCFQSYLCSISLSSLSLNNMLECVSEPEPELARVPVPEPQMV